MTMNRPRNGECPLGFGLLGFRGCPENSAVVLNIPDYRRARADRRAVADLDAGDQDRARSNEYPLTAVDVTAEHRAGRDMTIVTDTAVVIDLGARIDHNAGAQRRAGIDDRTGRKEAARANLGKWRYVGTGMSEGRQIRQLFFQQAPQSRAYAGVRDGHVKIAAGNV